jgi:glycosyltransferase involved in cell wall biosynthesis/predicted glycoside hydrolase/deacetylase ChbG (UPF0249 family)
MNRESLSTPPFGRASVAPRPVFPAAAEHAATSNGKSAYAASRGSLIINADDWGRDRKTTDRIHECALRKTVSSASAMVFMEDSERAAAIATDSGFDTGLHINLTTPFSAPKCNPQLSERQREIAAYLRRHPMARIMFYPFLARSFEYVLESQIDEYRRLYGADPLRFDGHHHMHLCSNLVFGNLLPRGAVVRRNFSFHSGEKNPFNRYYRKLVDSRLARRYKLTDYFFSIAPLEPPSRLQAIFLLAGEHVVEVETHPVDPDEYRFLMGDGIDRLSEKFKVTVAERYAIVPPRQNAIERASMSICEHPAPAETLDAEGKQESGGSAVSAVSSALAPETAQKQTTAMSVCVCTFKRPEKLKRLLNDLVAQETKGLFSYSIVIVDNDASESARSVVTEFAESSPIPVRYVVESRQGIAFARNKAIACATGEFVACMDDDEFPEKDWLLSMLKTCNEYGVDGVLGPVKRHFDEPPPKWVLEGRLYDRPTHPTGYAIHWKEARTGNILLRKSLFAGDLPFRPEFRAGEDQDFFRRMMEKGHRFVWCNEGVVYETVPPTRWDLKILLKRALLRGATAVLHPTFGPREVVKSIVAVPVYSVALPFALLFGYHRFVNVLIPLFDHLGKLLALMGVNVVKDQYVIDYQQQ